MNQRLRSILILTMFLVALGTAQAGPFEMGKITNINPSMYMNKSYMTHDLMPYKNLHTFDIYQNSLINQHLIEVKPHSTLNTFNTNHPLIDPHLIEVKPHSTLDTFNTNNPLIDPHIFEVKPPSATDEHKSEQDVANANKAGRERAERKESKAKVEEKVREDKAREEKAREEKAGQIRQAHADLDNVLTRMSQPVGGFKALLERSGKVGVATKRVP